VRSKEETEKESKEESQEVILAVHAFQRDETNPLIIFPSAFTIFS